MIMNIDSHTFDKSLLTQNGWVLDIGCRGFAFAKWCAENGSKVIAVDPDRDIVDPHIENVFFENIAVEVDAAPKTYAAWSSGEGNYLTNQPPDYSTHYTVKCMSIADIMSKYGVTQFDLIKIDCEGSEYGILRHLKENCTKQISVEFHDFLQRNPYYPDNERYYSDILSTSLQNFEVIQHEKRTMLPTGGPVNYWDSLFRLKNV